jgi:hypothetical protein
MAFGTRPGHLAVETRFRRLSSTSSHAAGTTWSIAMVEASPGQRRGQGRPAAQGGRQPAPHAGLRDRAVRALHRDLTDCPDRIADDGRSWRNVLRHHGAGADDRAIPDAGAAQNDCSSADSDVGADLDRRRVLEPFASSRHVLVVLGAVDLDMGPEHRRLADPHRRGVDNDAAGVRTRRSRAPDPGAKC